MRATILVDNTASFDRPLRAEHGLSILVDADGRRILFDTGASGLVIENARRLGFDLLDLDFHGPSVPKMLGVENERPVTFSGPSSPSA